MTKFTTEPRPGPQARRRAPGKSCAGRNVPPTSCETLESPRRCQVCGASLEGRRPQTRYCSPTCCSRAWDAAHGRARHVNEGKRAARLAVRS